MTKRMETNPLRCARHFMMQCHMILLMGGDDDNVDDSGNANNFDASNDNRNVEGSEGDVVGDTYDDFPADDNNVAINYAAYTADANNSDVGSNTNKDDANEADDLYEDLDGCYPVHGDYMIIIMLMTIPNMVTILAWMRSLCC